MLLLEAVTMMRGSRNMAIVNVFVRGVPPVPVEGKPSVEARGAAHPMRRTARARIDWGFMAWSREGGRLPGGAGEFPTASARDRKSTRLNSSHPSISYAVFCLKKKK